MNASHRTRRRFPLGQLLAHAILIAVSLLFIAPLLLIVSASITNEQSLLRNGYRLFPTAIDWSAYQYIFRDPSQILRSYSVTILVAFGGTALSLFVMALLSYPLSRSEFRFARPLSLVVFFTLLFNGGLVASYIINTQYLHLQDNLFALILPYLVGPFYVLLLRTYFAALPRELLEAARIDGASEWLIFFRIVLPLSTPALATVGLFVLLGYWNDYFLGLLYLNDSTKFPLQLLLFNILNNISFLSSNAAAQNAGVVVSPPTESVRMAMAVLATGPMAFVFLFVQKYFTRGLTVGSLKG